MSGVIKAIFGGGSDSSPVVNMIAPQAPQSPTAVAAPPARSDADIQASAAAQRKKYGVGSSTRTSFTGGLGVPSGSTYSATANLLGA